MMFAGYKWTVDEELGDITFDKELSLEQLNISEGDIYIVVKTKEGQVRLERQDSYESLE
jgi:hypothetical protein